MPQAKSPPPPQNQQCQKKATSVWWPSLSVVSMRVFLVTPVTVLTEDVDSDVMVITGRVVEPDDPLLPGGVVELASPGVEGVDIPGVEDPGVDDPGVDEPGVDDPGVDEPGVDEPGVDEPGVDEPGVDEPGVDEPGVDDPGVEDPGVDDAVADDPGVDVPGVEEPGVLNLGVEEPGVDDPGVDAPELKLKLTDDDPPAEDPLDGLDVGVLEGAVIELPVGVIGVDVPGLEEEAGLFVKLPVDNPGLEELGLKVLDGPAELVGSTGEEYGVEKELGVWVEGWTAEQEEPEPLQGVEIEPLDDELP